ncbi:MAG: STAS domain-containing protein [Pseudonocardia sp.]
MVGRGARRAQVLVDRPPACLAVRVTGPLLTGEELERSVAGALGGAGLPERVLLDVSGLTEIAAAGLDALLRLQERVLAGGSRLEVTGVSERVLQLLTDDSS